MPSDPDRYAQGARLGKMGIKSADKGRPSGPVTQNQVDGQPETTTHMKTRTEMVTWTPRRKGTGGVILSSSHI